MAKKGHFCLSLLLSAASACATTYLSLPQTRVVCKRRVKHASVNLSVRAVYYFDTAKEASAVE